MSILTLEAFLETVKDHELTVNIDQGVFRDLTVKTPDSVHRSYHITTRPNSLIFTGDMGSFVFTRLNDMFRFFRSDEYKINPDYWAEKVQAQDMRSGVKAFDSKHANQSLKDALSTYLSENKYSLDEQEIIEANNAVDSVDCSSQTTFENSMEQWDSEFSGGFSPSYYFDTDGETYTYRYLWCCYAIVHAIKLYDAQKAQVAV